MKHSFCSKEANITNFSILIKSRERKSEFPQGEAEKRMHFYSSPISRNPRKSRNLSIIFFGFSLFKGIKIIYRLILVRNI
jgi:hypothetical protein